MDMMKLMKQAREMQARVASMQEELEQPRPRVRPARAW